MPATSSRRRCGGWPRPQVIASSRCCAIPARWKTRSWRFSKLRKARRRCIRPWAPRACSRPIATALRQPERASAAGSRRLAGPDRNRVALFGIGHHAIMFVNAFGWRTIIALAVDDDKDKAGFFPPGLRVPVVGSEHLLADEQIRLCLFAVAPHIEGKVRDKLAALAARGVEFRSIYAALDNSIMKDPAHDPRSEVPGGVPGRGADRRCRAGRHRRAQGRGPGQPQAARAHQCPSRRRGRAARDDHRHRCELLHPAAQASRQERGLPHRRGRGRYRRVQG